MHSVLAILALAGAAVAQSGYGRFPCTIVNGDGSFSPDQTQCALDFLVAPGAGDGLSGAQGDNPNPTIEPECVKEAETGAYFCGIAGATCTADAQCDNGTCDLSAGTGTGTCQGGFLQGCAGNDAACSGYLYCLSNDFTEGTNLCGDVGAFCQDNVAVAADSTAEAAQLVFNQFCHSGYCSSTLGNCANLAALGESCAEDPEFQCGTGLTCETVNPTDATLPGSFTCVNAAVIPQPTGARARERRAAHSKKSLCPASHSACSVTGARGFECVDTTSNLEQCGACASAGGVDCTSLEGVASVGCVSGTCEIWACAEGFNWDASSQSCTA